MNNTPTPRTDLLTAKHWGDGFAAKYLKPEMQAMERELTAVTEQRDRLAEALLELRNNESMSLGGAAYEIIEQALQPLNHPKP